MIEILTCVAEFHLNAKGRFDHGALFEAPQLPPRLAPCALDSQFAGHTATAVESALEGGPRILNFHLVKTPGKSKNIPVMKSIPFETNRGYFTFLLKKK